MTETETDSGQPTFDISKLLAAVDFALAATEGNLAAVQIQLSGLKMWLAEHQVNRLGVQAQGEVAEAEGEVEGLLEQASPEARMEALKQQLSGLARMGLISHDQALRWWEDWKEHQPQTDSTKDTD